MKESWLIAYVSPGLHSPTMSPDDGVFFQPRVLTKRFNRRYRRVVSFQVPLIPGYAFVRTSDPAPIVTRYGSVIRGWARTDNGEHLSISQSEKEDLERLQTECLELGLYYDVKTYKHGDEVVVREDGFLADRVAKVTGTLENGKVEIEFGEGAFAIRRTLDPAQVEAA